MGKMISASQMKIFVVENGLYTYFKYGSNDLQVATYDELQGGEFNFINGHPSNVSGLLDSMISLEPDLELKAKLGQLKIDCTAYANQAEETPPEPIAPTIKCVDYLQGQDLILTLNEQLNEPVSVTTWLCNEGFKPENLGRGRTIDDPLKYRIALKDKRISGNIEVRVNKENVDFTVEAV